MKTLVVALLLSAASSVSPCMGQKQLMYEGNFSNGYKGAKISFVISADGKKLERLLFNGYWKCASGIEQTIVGPDKAFEIKDGKVDGIIVEPPGGGSTAWRFELHATIKNGKANGTFRMNINNLGCDSYLLQWSAAKK